MIKLIAIAALGLSVAGCVTTSNDASLDVQKCRYEAKKAQMGGRSDAITGAVEFHSLVSDCMRINGAKA